MNDASSTLLPEVDPGAPTCCQRIAGPAGTEQEQRADERAGAIGDHGPDGPGHRDADVPAPRDGEPPVVLHVDDEPYVLSAVRRVLHPMYRVLSAGSGAAGLAVLSGNAVHVVISDQRMPGMTGTEFLAQVRAQYPDTVRVMLSGYCDVHTVTEAMRASSIYRFVPKPWSERELLQVVAAAVRFGVNDREWRRRHAPCEAPAGAA